MIERSTKGAREEGETSASRVRPSTFGLSGSSGEEARLLTSGVAGGSRDGRGVADRARRAAATPARARSAGRAARSAPRDTRRRRRRVPVAFAVRASRPWVPPDQGSTRDAIVRGNRGMRTHQPCGPGPSWSRALRVGEETGGAERGQPWDLAFAAFGRVALARAPREARAPRTPKALVRRDAGLHARCRGEARTRARALTRGDRDLHGERHASHFDDCGFGRRRKRVC